MPNRPVEAATKRRPSRRNDYSPTLAAYSDWDLPCFFSVVRQMPGYNLKKGHGLRTPIMEAFGQNDSTKVADAIGQSEPRPSGSNSHTSFRKGQTDRGSSSHQLQQPLAGSCHGLQQDNKPVTVSTPSDTIFMALFSNSSYAFSTQQWIKLARNGILSLRETPPLVIFLVGWLVSCLSFLSHSKTAESISWLESYSNL
jgi:hypothetical protein